MRRGGLKYRSGADTCVFKPAVKCQDESDPRPGVSRIMEDDKSEHDIKIETLIRTKFPELVANGSVTVHEHVCTPVFTEGDIKEDDTYEPNRGCSDIVFAKEDPYGSNVFTVIEGPRRHLKNLITPERDTTLASFIDKGKVSLETKKKIIRNAIDGAVGLCPDDGRPWVIHTDCHLGNVLVSGSTSSLNDWGRCIIVDNPTDFVSILKGIKDLFLEIYKNTSSESVIEKKYQTNEDIAKLITYLGDRGQHPKDLINKLSKALKENNLEETRKILRGWTCYVVLRQVFGDSFTDKTFLNCASQSHLQRKVNVFLPVPKPATQVPTTTTATPPPGPPKPKGGKTRKNRKGRKRTLRRR
jgi:hypothetical protein